MIELTPEEKSVVEKMASSERVEVKISFSIVGLERFAGTGTAAVHVDGSDEIMKMQATHAVSNALLSFYENIEKIQETFE